MKWVSMAEQLHTSLRSPCAMSSVGWSGVMLTSIGLWSRGISFSGMMNQDSPSGSQTDKTEFGGCQENTYFFLVHFAMLLFASWLLHTLLTTNFLYPIVGQTTFVSTLRTLTLLVRLLASHPILTSSHRLCIHVTWWNCCTIWSCCHLLHIQMS